MCRSRTADHVTGTDANHVKKRLRHLILSIGQINRYSDSFFQLLGAHDLGEPGGAQVLIIDITEGMGIEVESEHSVIGDVIDSTGDAVPVKRKGKVEESSPHRR